MTARKNSNLQSQAIHLSITPLFSRVLVLLLAFIMMQILLRGLSGPLYILEERLGTLPWQLAPDNQPEERLAIVAIDELSLQAFGPWPWPRSLLTELSDRLAQQGARLQLFDLVLPETKEGDAQLQQSLISNQAFLGQIPFSVQPGVSQQPPVTGHPVRSPVETFCGPAPQATGFIANHNIFRHIPAGHIAAEADTDGSIRHQPAGYCYQGQFYPSLALSAYQTLFRTSELQWLSADKTEHPLLAPAYRLINRDNTLFRIPTDSEGRVRISYEKHPDSFTVYSAADLLNGTLPEKAVHNKLVLIGATAFGLGDIVPTPHSGITPGVELQARLLSSMLDNRVPYTPSGQWLYQGMLLISIALLLLIAAQRAAQQQHPLSRTSLLIAPILLPLLLMTAHSLVLQQHSLWLGWLVPALFAVIAAPMLAALEYLRNRHERQRLYDNLSRYLPMGFARKTALQRPNNQIEVEEKNVVVLSADLRNFSAFQQCLPSQDSARLLHRFFTQAGQLIHQHGGVLYELHADSLLAIWPLASDRPDTTGPGHGSGPTAYRQSLNAARDLYLQLQPLLQQELPEPLVPLDLAVGLSAGTVTAGSLGCGGLRTHMLMGEAVTLALRLQQMSQELASPVLVDRSIAVNLKTEEVHSQGRYLLEGVAHPREIFSVPLTVPGVTDSGTVIPMRRSS